MNASLHILLRQEFDRVVQEQGHASLANVLIAVAQVSHDSVNQALAVKQRNVLRRLVLEEVVETAESQHDKRLRVLCITYEPQHGLNVDRTCITCGECFVGRRMQQVDSVEVHAGEGLFDGVIEQLVNDFNLLRRHFRAMVVLSCGKNLAHCFKVDQVLGIKHVQFSIELQDLLFRSVELDLIKVDWSCARDSLTCLFLCAQELIHHLVVRWWRF